MSLKGILSNLKTDKEYWGEQKKQELAISRTIIALNEDEDLQKIMAVVLEDPVLCSSLKIINKTELKFAIVREKMNKLRELGVAEKITFCVDKLDRTMKDDFPEYRLRSFVTEHLNRLRLFTPKL